MRVRLLIAPLVAAVLFAAALIASPVAEGAPVKPCASSGLVVWVGLEEGGATAGSVFYRIELTNLSGHTCTVSGFPEVSAVNLQGQTIGAAAGHTAGQQTKTIKLAPDHAARASLQIVEALNFPAAKCNLTWAAGLRIGVPGGAGSKIAPLAFETCALASAKTLSVAPVTIGAL
jgi:Protein of unknown function (DUF4232)